MNYEDLIHLLIISFFGVYLFLGLEKFKDWSYSFFESYVSYLHRSQKRRRYSIPWFQFLVKIVKTFLIPVVMFFLIPVIVLYKFYNPFLIIIYEIVFEICLVIFKFFWWLVVWRILLRLR